MENPFFLIYNNIKEKTASPFFSSLIFVWFVRNWDLIFTIFYFDKSFTLDQKIKRINDYYNNKIFLCELGLNILYATLLMILGYSLIVATKVFINWGENKVIPYLFSKTVSKTVVEKKTFEELQLKYESNLTEIVAKSKLLQDIENLNTNLKVEKKGLQETIESKDNEISTFKSTTKLLQTNTEQLTELIDGQKEAYTEINRMLKETQDRERELYNLNQQRINDFHFFLNWIISDVSYLPSIDLKKENFSKEIQSKIAALQHNDELLNFFRLFIKNDYSVNSEGISYNVGFLMQLKNLGLISYDTEMKDFHKHERIHLTYFGNFMSEIFDLHP